MRKVIDFERKGNVVRFYLGDDSLEDWCGDDWNDAPYEYNAGVVYPRYCIGAIDLLVPFDCGVYDPQDGFYNSTFSKDDMKARVTPCIVVLDENAVKNLDGCDYFGRAVGMSASYKVYFGEPEDDIVCLAEQVGAVVNYIDEGWWSDAGQA